MKAASPEGGYIGRAYAAAGFLGYFFENNRRYGEACPEKEDAYVVCAADIDWQRRRASSDD